MGFKNMKRNFTFTDLSLFASMEKNRAITRMEEINAIVNWSPIEALLGDVCTTPPSCRSLASKSPLKSCTIQAYPINIT